MRTEEPVTVSASGRTLRIWPGDPAQGIVYFPAEKEETDSLHRRLPACAPSLAGIGGVCWELDLTPWPSVRAFRGGKDFSGGADAFLSQLTAELLPLAEGVTGKPAFRCLAGYSLGGLFAAYAATRTDRFRRIASVSGSLWYDGWADYLNAPGREIFAQRAVFLLGEREKQARNPRLAAVEAATAQTATAFRTAGCDTRFALLPGGHFDDAEERLAQAVMQTSD